MNKPNVEVSFADPKYCVFYYVVLHYWTILLKLCLMYVVVVHSCLNNDYLWNSCL